jgi:hypothetical protein
MTHDQNFKNLILDYRRPALEFFAAPEAVAIPADARILPVRQEPLQERLGDRFRELDTPLLVEWPEGREAGPATGGRLPPEPQRGRPRAAAADQIPAPADGWKSVNRRWKACWTWNRIWTSG